MPTFEVDGTEYGLPEMLEANLDDEPLCAWLRSARVGERFPALISCVRLR
jgi:hypothetical protein